jgi:hypothetical protein
MTRQVVKLYGHYRVVFDDVLLLPVWTTKNGALLCLKLLMNGAGTVNQDGSINWSVEWTRKNT